MITAPLRIHRRHSCRTLFSPIEHNSNSSLKPLQQRSLVADGMSVSSLARWYARFPWRQ